MTNSYNFGAVYILEDDYTEDEIERDLQNMSSCGYNLVTFWPVTNPLRSKNSHDWNFDTTKFALDICNKLGMKVILQLFGQNQAYEFMPDSALTREMEIHDENGEVVNENCFWANINHPVVREYIELFFKTAINTLKEHPALFGWDVFNEAHFRSDDDWTVRLYQEWLKKKYENIENLNRSWNRRYESFAQISPVKRHSAYVIWSSLLPELDYEKFRSVNLTDFCRFLYDTAKKYDSIHPIIIDGTSSQITAPYLTQRNNDEFETALIPDIYGATFYPKSWGKNYKETPWTAAMYFAVPAWAAHRAKKPYYVNEIQTHTQSALTPGSEVTPFELCSWILMNIFSGAEGIQLWRWRPFLHGYQVTGRGLTRLDGSPNERSKAVEDLLKKIREIDVLNKCFNNGITERHKRSFKPLKPDVKIVIGYDVRLYFDSLLKWKDSFWAKNMEGWYRAFWEQGAALGFANLLSLDKDDFATPVLVLPSAVRVSEDEAIKLREYVKNGGTLIADGRLAALNEKACAPSFGIPGKVLSEVFGVREIDVSSGGWFNINGKKIPAPYMHQIIEIFDNAEIIAKMDDGNPAVVSHFYGKGKTIFFNSFIGLEMYKGVDEELKKLLAKNIPIDSISAVKSPLVHAAYIENENKKAALLINFNDKNEEVILKNFGEKQKTITLKAFEFKILL